jgi:hypothetical protein
MTAVSSGGRGDGETDGRALWRRRFEAQVLRAGEVLEGDGYLYRPGQLLVHADDHPHVADRLDAYGLVPHREHSDRLGRHGLALHAYRLPDGDGHRVPEIVRELRGAVTTRRLGVSPNHVFVGAPGYAPGGAGVPQAAPPVDEVQGDPYGEPMVSLLDTGLPRRLADWHPPLAAASVNGADAVDDLDADGDGLLDLEAGHGTFVAGVLRRHAPWLSFAVERVLSPSGLGDEIDIACGLLTSTAPVVNMSLGAYTYDDQPPLALVAAVAQLGVDRLVVAAAGNEATDRPYWPAALPDVVAVGGTVDGTVDGGYEPRRAEFSNYGDWVDACAPAVDIQSTYVVGDYPVGGHVTSFDGWARWSGTSFAAPRVAAAVAGRMRERGLTARRAWESLLSEDRARLDGLGVVFPGDPVRLP